MTVWRQINTIDEVLVSRISESCYSIPSGRIPLDFVRFKPTLADEPALLKRLIRKDRRERWQRLLDLLTTCRRCRHER